MRHMFVLVAALCLGACASHGEPVRGGQLLAPGVMLHLPSAPVFGDGLDVTQLVQARYQDRHQLFQSFIQSRSGHFVVLMTVPSGPRIMRLDWSAGGLVSEKETIAPDALTPERMLADLMVVYASQDTLRNAISGGRVMDELDGTRHVSVDGQDVIVARRPSGDIWAGSATLKNLAFDYVLNIQSQRASP